MKIIIIISTLTLALASIVITPAEPMQRHNVAHQMQTVLKILKQTRQLHNKTFESYVTSNITVNLVANTLNATNQIDNLLRTAKSTLNKCPKTPENNRQRKRLKYMKQTAHVLEIRSNVLFDQLYHDTQDLLTFPHTAAQDTQWG